MLSKKLQWESFFKDDYDLDFGNIMEEARTRWLRPNEIHAILCNYKYFVINVKPVHLPKSGTIVLFDRKKLRNFRKDGHNWKKKKDGKTVKEAHEHLKVGNEERIHVYYAHGEDNQTFVRRCYWLLDKTLEHIVLVHYRETQEFQGSPVTPMNSNSSSISDQSPWLISEEFDSGAGNAYHTGEKEHLGPTDNLTVRNHEMKLHEINTLDWDELVMNDPNNSPMPKGVEDGIVGFDRQNQIAVNGSVSDGSSLPIYNLSAEISSLDNLTEVISRSNNAHFNSPGDTYSKSTSVQINSNAQNKDSIVPGTGDSLDLLVNDGLQSQDSFGRWINSIIAESSGSVDNPLLESSISSGHDSFTAIDQLQSFVPEQMFVITDISHTWSFSTETTKILVTGYFLHSFFFFLMQILVTGYFHEQYLHLTKSNLVCVCGDTCIPAEIIQAGAYRCLVPPHSPGLSNLFLSLDGHKPISQVLNFEYRSPLHHPVDSSKDKADPLVSSEDKPNWEEFKLKMSLAFLLSSTSKSLDVLTSKVSPTALKEAKKFAHKISDISNTWAYLMKSIEDNRVPFPQAKDVLFELTLKNMLKEWLLERVIQGCKSTEYDAQGRGVIHLCAILGYTWAIYLFSWSGLSLDFRDKRGWTALHWAAYYGREKMVAVLLSAGAKPNLVTDPTSENPGGRTAADLAYENGYDGLAAYLSEKSLVAHFKDMSIAGNASGMLQLSAAETVNSENLNEEDLYLKDTLAAYQTAADAAARIQAAFREHSFKIRTKAVEFANPEDEARNIIAAMKIQHAFRNFDTRKKMAAAARIQFRFRTWKMRKEFLNMRRQAVRIQAAFRGFQVRRQYRKIVWSVGVVEKAILRWRLKRKGFRGLHVNPVETVEYGRQESDPEEDFYKASRKQAEERVERSVVRVQAMFRSKKAQEEYRRMKLAHNQAELDYEELRDHDMNF
ncbi:calmodulin-binding transcription activator 5 isoform X2 [Jatropha curcas]|uniref:calmodulin-binding transcription activator 5 isoform X2 n=1 Tax=Jatropha curcas TaxID=180498 RepID=UPI001895CEFB|nr:calmodulin-binding transcription activator 5 isoform X2 [Jatropha curcas]